MNKEIQEFQESFFFGLSMRQCFFSVLAICFAAVGVYLGTKRYLWNGDCRMAECFFAAAPFCGMWFFRYHQMTLEKFVWVWLKSEILCPKKAGVSIGESLSEMSGRDNRNRNTFLQKWHGAGRTKEKQK